MAQNPFVEANNRADAGYLPSRLKAGASPYLISVASKIEFPTGTTADGSGMHELFRRPRL
jgi:hypothetical protein